MRLKNYKFINILLLSLLFTSCGNPATQQSLKVADDIELIEGVEYDYDNAFFDDFSKGVSKDNWYIGKQAWGGANGGVIPQNVNYTDDGVLILTGNGKYYNDNDVIGVGDIKDGRYTGSVLISKFLVKPGHYEIRMKVLPRQGACTAFWTYAYEIDDALNHEIDIELPGGNRSQSITFANLLNTNYITEQRSQSQDTNTAEIFSNEKYFNDGNWHTFGFDWYSNPETIVYFVDGKISAISDIFIPTLQSRLWLGCWFPVTSGFVGAAEFETDNMYVDYVEYIPFKNQPFQPYEPFLTGVAMENEYPSQPVSMKEQNKIANGNFERLSLENSKGWVFTKYLNEDKNLEEVVEIGNDGIDDSQSIKIRDGGVIYQNIDSVYNGFKHDFSLFAKGEGKITIRYYGTTMTDVLSQETLNINCEELKEFNKELKAPSGCRSMRITIDAGIDKEITVDNMNLIQL